MSSHYRQRRLNRNDRRCTCCICMNDLTQLNNCYTWVQIAKLVLSHVHLRRNTLGYLSLSAHIFPFIHAHAHYFKHLKKFRSAAPEWHKSMIDAMSHSPEFETGKNDIHSNGFWRLANPCPRLREAIENNRRRGVHLVRPRHFPLAAEYGNPAALHWAIPVAEEHPAQPQTFVVQFVPIPPFGWNQPLDHDSYEPSLDSFYNSTF